MRGLVISKRGGAVMRARPATPSSGRPKPLYPQLKPRRNASHEAVAAHQRARLHSAIVEACVRKGVAATSVNELVSIAGVSKKTLYKHFDNKEECFLATYDLVIRDAVARISAAYTEGPEDERDWAAGLCHAFDAFVAELVERPERSRLALVDVLMVGPNALERIERAEAVFIWMIARSLAQAPDAVPLPPLLLKSLVGGIWFVSRSRLLEGEAATVSERGRELLDWILAYRAPVAASLPKTDVLPRRWSGSLLDSAAGDARTRMLYAAAQIVTRGGYLSLSVEEIAERADVSPVVFSAEFDSPGECFWASLELLSAQALARALRESGGAPDWAAGVCRAIHALLCQIAEDRVLARVAFVEAVAAGPAGVERRAALIRGFANVLLSRAPREHRPSPLVAEAIVGSVWSIAYRYVAEDRAHLLPSLSGHAAYLALVPVIGAAEAYNVISAELGPGATRKTEPSRVSSAAGPSSAVALA